MTPAPGDVIKFNTDQIAKFDLWPDETWALAGEKGKIIGTETPGNLELFWVSTWRKPAFLINMKNFEIISKRKLNDTSTL